MRHSKKKEADGLGAWLNTRLVKDKAADEQRLLEDETAPISSSCCAVT